MALSMKDQINVKLTTARDALLSAIKRLDEELKPFTKETVRDNEKAYKLWLQRDLLNGQLLAIMKLYESSGKKQKARLILAFCTGTLKDGSACDYKIRASLSVYMRGVPTCPDPMCDMHGKAFEVETKDEEIDQQIDAIVGADETMKYEMEQSAQRKQRRLERAGKDPRISRFGRKQADMRKDVSATTKPKPIGPVDMTFSDDDSHMFYEPGERKPK